MNIEYKLNPYKTSRPTEESSDSDDSSNDEQFARRKAKGKLLLQQTMKPRKKSTRFNRDKAVTELDVDALVEAAMQDDEEDNTTSRKGEVHEQIKEILGYERALEADLDLTTDSQADILDSESVKTAKELKELIASRTGPVQIEEDVISLDDDEIEIVQNHVVSFPKIQTAAERFKIFYECTKCWLNFSRRVEQQSILSLNLIDSLIGSRTTKVEVSAEPKGPLVKVKTRLNGKHEHKWGISPSDPFSKVFRAIYLKRHRMRV